MIRASRVAEISLPDVWPEKRRNPLFYTTLDALGIDVSTLDFRDVNPPDPAFADALSDEDDVRPLTIAEAKKGLAKGLAIAQEQIEIIIKV
jgi:hypothetical protein